MSKISQIWHGTKNASLALTTKTSKGASFMRTCLLPIFLVLSSLLGLTTKCLADTIAVTTTPGASAISNENWVLGYSFVANQNIFATSLGVYDHGSDGLLQPHEVGLWNSSGTLLAQVTVGAGVSGILDASYRFESISPVALASGQTYYVGAVVPGPGGDPWLQDPATLVAASEITYSSRRYQSGTTLIFPDLAGTGTTGYFGGNFQFVTQLAEVPEPASIALWSMLSVAGLAAWRRRKSVGTNVA